MTTTCARCGKPSEIVQRTTPLGVAPANWSCVPCLTLEEKKERKMDVDFTKMIHDGGPL